MQCLVDIFEYIRFSITQYSADLHKKLIEMSVKCLLRDFWNGFFLWLSNQKHLIFGWMCISFLFPETCTQLKLIYFVILIESNFQASGKILRNTNLKNSIIIFCDMMFIKRTQINKTPIENAEIYLFLYTLGYIGWTNLSPC